MKKRISKIWQLSNEEFYTIIKNSNSLREVLLKLGFCGSGNSFNTLKSRIDLEDIDCSHFIEGRDYKSRFNKKSNKDVFVENSSYDRSGIKKRIIEQKLILYECNICGIKDLWHNIKLVLILDHINGVNNDHRLSNLRFLCPNCNSQQDTFGSRNRYKYSN